MPLPEVEGGSDRLVELVDVGGAGMSEERRLLPDLAYRAFNALLPFLAKQSHFQFADRV